MRSMLVSLLLLVCLACISSPVHALPLLSSARSGSSAPSAAATSKSHYFVGFTEDGQLSRGDVFNDESVRVTGLAGSSFLTSRGLFKLTGGVLLIETSERPLNVVVQSRSYATQPHSLYIFDMHGPVIRRDSKGAPTERERKAQHLWRFASGYACASQPSRITASQGSLFSVGARRIVVAQGSLLIDAPANTVIGTPVGYLTCGKRFLTSLRTVANALCVENLTVPRTISLTVKGATIPLETGRCGIVKSGLPCVDTIPFDGLPRRSFVARTNGGITVVTADFMASALFRSQKHMSESIMRPFTPYQTKLSQELLKGTAAVQVATGGKGAFCWRPAHLPACRLGAVMDPVASQSKASLLKLPPGAILLR
ncbi:MAG: hypothetical protein K2W95_35985 [Candidatus Obscuribacterales bacterium]|nr:hypothetical protein [Candidatus Obscuribacterales bacterium]